MAQLNAQAAGRPLSAAVEVGVKTDVSDPLVHVAKLGELKIVEMRSQYGHGVGKAILPQSSHIEQAFHHNDAGKSESLGPTIQSAFGARQEAVAAEAIANRTAIQIAGLLQRERQTAKETIAAPFIHQTAFHQSRAFVAEPLEVAAQTDARCVTDAHAFDHGAVLDPACCQIRPRILEPRQLPLIET